MFLRVRNSVIYSTKYAHTNQWWNVPLMQILSNTCDKHLQHFIVGMDSYTKWYLIGKHSINNGKSTHQRSSVPKPAILTICNMTPNILFKIPFSCNGLSGYGKGYASMIYSQM